MGGQNRVTFIKTYTFFIINIAPIMFLFVERVFLPIHYNDVLNIRWSDGKFYSNVVGGGGKPSPFPHAGFTF